MHPISFFASRHCLRGGDGGGALCRRLHATAFGMVASVVTLCISIAAPAGAEGTLVTLSIDSTHPGREIPPDYAGLSYELALLRPDANGACYFCGTNTPLVALFRALGIKSLRVGGNTSDRNVIKLPEQEDLDSLFAFAKAAEVKVIYCLRLHDGDPEIAAATVKYIMDRYAPLVDSFSIGQPYLDFVMSILISRPPASSTPPICWQSAHC
jgi:hypothetical protein